MRKFLLPFLALLLLSVGACSTKNADGTVTPGGLTAALASPDVMAAVGDAFKQGCAAVSIADGSFKAVAPALVVSGKLKQDAVDKEASIIASVQVTCANPPADLAVAVPTLLGQAAAIYLLVATP